MTCYHPTHTREVATILTDGLKTVSSLKSEAPKLQVFDTPENASYFGELVYGPNFVLLAIEGEYQKAPTVDRWDDQGNRARTLPGVSYLTVSIDPENLSIFEPAAALNL